MTIPLRHWSWRPSPWPGRDGPSAVRHSLLHCPSECLFVSVDGDAPFHGCPCVLSGCLLMVGTMAHGLLGVMERGVVAVLVGIRSVMEMGHAGSGRWTLARVWAAVGERGRGRTRVGRWLLSGVMALLRRRWRAAGRWSGGVGSHGRRCLRMLASVMGRMMDGALGVVEGQRAADGGIWPWPDLGAGLRDRGRLDVVRRMGESEEMGSVGAGGSSWASVDGGCRWGRS
ncbi:hypothetical protein ACLOJK_024825 [Asimina triloba]